jgi:SAM-dependent methyltransferase
MTPRLRTLLFETLYRNASLYRFASTVPFAGQWRIWQRQVLPRLHGRDILEVGCGLGDLLADMLDAGYVCQAVERSPQMVRAARTTLRRRHAGSPDLIIQGSAQALPFAENSFDCVVSTFPAEYISDPATIAEVARVLRPGGHLIVLEGANLLPVGCFQPILLLVHLLVYGFSTLPGRRQDPAVASPSEQTGGGVSSENIDEAVSGLRIPLEQAGLHRRCEIVRSRRWEVFLTSGEKI